VTFGKSLGVLQIVSEQSFKETLGFLPGVSHGLMIIKVSMEKSLQLTILRGHVILQTEKPAREPAHLFHRMDSMGLENSAGLGYQTRHQNIDHPSHRLTDPQFFQLPPDILSPPVDRATGRAPFAQPSAPRSTALNRSHHPGRRCYRRSHRQDR